MFDDLHLVPEAGRAVAVFSASAARRAALADALSWHVSRRFQAPGLETQDVLELRAAGALADRIDLFRDSEEMAPIRLTADEARTLIEASWAYIAERDIEAYQPPAERERIAELGRLVDPLFDLVRDLDRADEVLRTQSL